MPELRKSPIVKRWVIIATDRARRPSDFHSEKKEASSSGGFCPFCMGNEDKTPPEIYALPHDGRHSNTPGWLTRVVPNKFPALAIEGDLGRRGLGLFDIMNGIGAHEVIIETPQHDLEMGDMPIPQLRAVLHTYRARILDLINDTRLRYMLIFKNFGRAAGASLEHPHTQLIATPITPRAVKQELESAQSHFFDKERCLFCDILYQEIKDQERIVSANEHFVALCPFASRFPFETWIFPRKHSAHFSHASDDLLHNLALVLRDTLKRIALALDSPPYNFVLHNAPNIQGKARRPGYWQTLDLDYHWHIEIMPRVTKVAGFEWGTGFYINPTPPEQAAQYLRDVEVSWPD
ncbi:MAG: galactose-1-phosphate uridylyltransferase [Candidatus Coatesbacteria bacterium]|nr:galactose-1-phosphate uridylyltransferase [Candidatus Coatesbacteria bacterium]